MPPDIRFCPRCGAPAPLRAFCGDCGAELPAGTRFCARCGTPAAAFVPDPAPGTGHSSAATAPSPPSRRARSHSALVAAAFAAVLVLAGLGVWAFTRSPWKGDAAAPPQSNTAVGPASNAAAAPESTTATGAGVTVARPAGWFVREQGERGLVLASRREDLEATSIQGPRLRLETGGVGQPEVSTILRESMPAPGGAAAGLRSALTDGPATRRVGGAVNGADGVAITLREEEGGRPFIRRYVTVNTGGGRVYQFLLEAPADQWAATSAVWDQILDSATFAFAPVAPRELAAPRERSFAERASQTDDPRLKVTQVANEWEVEFHTEGIFYWTGVRTDDWGDRYRLEAWGRIMDGPPGTGLGIGLRLAPDPSRYRVFVMAELGGEYYVHANTADQGEVLLVPRTRQSLLKGGGQLNVFTVVVDKTEATVALNGRLLTTFRLPAVRTMFAGIYAQPGPQAPARVRFSYLSGKPLG